jgi:predicted NBD/HSP70 family sugar kinase
MQMRRIDPNRFHVATRGTSRHINRQIALTLIGSHQPISRADLARRMKMRRGAVGLLVQELLNDHHVVEGPTGAIARGRKPTLLYINTRKRSSVAVDIRASRIFLMLADPLGQPLSDIVTMPTTAEPRACVAAVAARIRQLLDAHEEIAGKCQGIGVVVPGMVDSVTGTVLHAPTLGWRDVDLRPRLAAATGFSVHVENSGRACALAQMWEARSVAAAPVRNLVFISVSDGVGVGVVVNGELLRGRHNIAGEFAHMPLNLDGPRCSCGAIGCWEAYISNLATLTRYFDRAPHVTAAGDQPFTIDDLIARARAGDRKAVTALQASARYLGLGLAGVINIIDPDCVFIGGEITTAWDLIEGTVRAALAGRALTPAAALTDIVIVSAEEHSRLRGAAMLVAAPTFAAPVVA